MTVKQPQRDFEALLHPTELRSALLLASLYVLAYESFQDGVIDHLRMLHFRGIDASGWKIDEDEYRRDVLSRDKHPLRASLLWFHEYGAINAADLTTADRLRGTRNKLVHELWKLLGTEELAPLLQDFSELLRIYRKVEVWRILNLEIDGDPDFDGQAITEDDVIPGPMMFLRMLFDVALGDDNEAWSYYKHFTEAANSSAQGSSRSEPAA
jgi:hypothetical protein